MGLAVGLHFRLKMRFWVRWGASSSSEVSQETDRLTSTATLSGVFLALARFFFSCLVHARRLIPYWRPLMYQGLGLALVIRVICMMHRHKTCSTLLLFSHCS